MFATLVVALFTTLSSHTGVLQQESQVAAGKNTGTHASMSEKPPPVSRGMATEREFADRNNIYGTIADKIKDSVIVIDPGHGGKDYGTCSGELFEKDINLDISLRLGELLKEEGIKTVFTRESDAYIDLKSRANMANEIGADLFISIHVNGMDGNDTSSRGSETLYCTTEKYKDAKLNSKKLAQIVQKHMVNKLGTRDNGIKYRPNLAVLRLTKMPAIIAEVGYISNPSDREKLASSEFRKKAAAALHDACIEALNLRHEESLDDGEYELVQ